MKIENKKRIKYIRKRLEYWEKELEKIFYDEEQTPSITYPIKDKYKQLDRYGLAIAKLRDAIYRLEKVAK